MVVGARRSSDNLDTKAIHTYQRKMTKIQRTGIRLMAAGAQRTNSDLRVEANHFIRGAHRRGKSLKNASAQRTDCSLIAMLQRMVKSKVVTEHQTTTCLQATSVQWIDHILMAMLQQTTIPRVVASWQTNLTPQATRAQWMNYGPMIVLQWTARSRVVSRPQAVGSSIAKNSHPCKRYPPQEEGSVKDSSNKREVKTIFGRSCKVGNSPCARENYAHETKALPHAMVKTTNSTSPRGTTPKPQYIIFTETDARLVHLLMKTPWSSLPKQPTVSFIGC